MDTLILSENEIKIINTLRTMKPYERVEIMADAKGRPDSYLVSRSTKILLVYGEEKVYVK